MIWTDSHRFSMIDAAARHDAEAYRAFFDTLRAFQSNPEGKRILDIGCGANSPMTLMLHCGGAKVTGIDQYVGHRWGLGFRPSRYAHYCREVGVLKTMRKAAGELVYDQRYYSALAAAAGFPLFEKGLDLRQMRAEALQFEDRSVDLVYSNATWEHLADVRRANAEVARVLRPGGLAYIEIHLFPSLSGGHDLPWKVPGRGDLGGIRPWRHLREPSRAAPVYLNRLRESQYRALFEETRDLDILDWKTEFTEGEDLITQDLLEELRDYTREELTRRSVIVVLQKRSE